MSIAIRAVQFVIGMSIAVALVLVAAYAVVTPSGVLP